MAKGNIPAHLEKGCGIILVVGTFTILLAFPFYWMLITSFKQNVDLYTMENNPFIFNVKPTLDHLKFLFNETDSCAGWATPRSLALWWLPSRCCWPCLPPIRSPG